MRLRAAFGVGMVVGVTTMLIPGAVQAETAYRYWSYWTGGEQWNYSARGPGFRVPPDRGVEGWRFVVSPKDGSQATPPGASNRFDDLCPAVSPAPAGEKNVAVVIEFGAAGIAPVGETPPPPTVSCVTVPTAETGLQILQGVAPLRFHPSGLICGVAGFPATECPGQTSRSTSPQPSTGDAPPAARPTPVAAPTTVTAPTPTRRSANGQATPSAAADDPTPVATGSPSAWPSPVALPLDSGDTSGDPPSPPAWITAIGAAMIATLLGIAVLVRRGRS